MGADAPATCAMGVGEAGRGEGAGPGDHPSLVKRGDETFYPWAVLGG